MIPYIFKELNVDEELTILYVKKFYELAFLILISCLWSLSGLSIKDDVLYLNCY